MRNFLTVVVVFLLIGCGSPKDNKIVLEQAEANENPVLEFGDLPSHDLSNSDLKIRIDWIKGPFPNASQNSELMVIITDSNDNLKSVDSKIELYTFMPSMGHGSADDGVFSEVSEGVYVNSTIKFSMGGDWAIYVRLYNEDGEVESEALWDEFL